MERTGIIDLGSNTTRLIVMEYQSRYCFRLIDEVRETVRLAQGIGEDGRLQSEAMYRTVEVMKMFHALCRGTGVNHIVAVATSALRDATNQGEFLHTLKQEADLDMRILSGQEEAYYGYLGTVNSLPISDAFLVDIGGGSTELTAVCDRHFQHWLSQPAGAIRCTERYVNSDPISSKDYRKLHQAAEALFAQVEWLGNAPDRVLVGIGGTVRNLAKIDQKRRKYPLERLHGYVMDRRALESTINLLRKKDLAGRKGISGLNSDRADIILAGAVILHCVMQQGNFDQILISGQGLREGLFYEHFLQHQSVPLFDNVRDFGVLNLARLSGYEVAHAHKVRELSFALFDQLQALHGYGAWERELLGHAALLHDIGSQVTYYDHHKHSAYLVTNTTLSGFTPREVALLAILVRSHRKGDVKTGDYTNVLQEGDDERAQRLSSLLRLAEFMERSKSQVVDYISVEFEMDMVRVRLHSRGDITVELWDANQRSDLFKQSFGRDIEIVGARP